MKKKKIDKKEFNFLNMSSCDKLSEMKGIDLQQFLTELDDYYLSLRKKINIPSDITFGMEIEYQDANRRIVTNSIEQKKVNRIILSGWDSGTDGTVTSGDHGGELRSPVCTDTPEYWNDLKEICEILKDNNAITNKAGGHIHVGSNIFTDNIDVWLRFFKIWTIYEKVFYRFSYGNKLFARSSMEQYAYPISGKLYNLIEKGYDGEDITYKLHSDSRYGCVNFCNFSRYGAYHKNTIEFRCPNSSIEEAIWQNNVNLFTKLLLSCRKDNYDDIINFKIKRYSDSSEINKPKFYGEIFLQEALEISDMIFDNNLDKIYFLRQYLKNFDDCRVGQESKLFIK